MTAAGECSAFNVGSCSGHVLWGVLRSVIPSGANCEPARTVGALEESLMGAKDSSTALRSFDKLRTPRCATLGMAPCLAHSLNMSLNAYWERI